MSSINFVKPTIFPMFKHLRLRFASSKPRKTSPKIVKVRVITSEKKQKKPKITQVEKHFMQDKDLAEVKDLVPTRFFKINRQVPDDLYLFDRKVARGITESLVPNILDPNKFVIETNPGIGLLTKELLNAGLPKIQVYESTVSFREEITKLGSKYPGRITQYDTDLFLIWKLSYQDRHDSGDRVKKMLSNVVVKEWEEEPSMTIVGTLTNPNFIRYLILSLIFQFGMMTRGRCEMYLCIPPTLYLQLTAKPEDGYVSYLSSSVLFQLFFNYEILKKVPRNAFLPWYKDRSSTRFRPRNINDNDFLYLTRIEFKEELPVPLERLQHLWYFVRHIMTSRKRRIIPCLEKWIPGCGVRFIIKSTDEWAKENNFFENMDIFTQIGQLNATQILNLYKEFSSLPEYLESPFIASMETTLVKMESSQAFEEQVKSSQKDSLNKEEENINVQTVTEQSKDLNRELENR